MHRNPAQEAIVNLMKLKHPDITQENIEKVKMDRPNKCFVAIYKTIGDYNLKVTRTVRIDYTCYSAEFKKLYKEISAEHEYMLTNQHKKDNKLPENILEAVKKQTHQSALQQTINRAIKNTLMYH